MSNQSETREDGDEAFASLHAAVQSGEVRAISIDTSYFERNKFNLSGGVLRRLEQFRAGTVKVVLSSVVVAEMRAHMVEAAEKYKRDVVKLIKERGNHWSITEPVRDDVIALLFKGRDPDEVAHQKLQHYLDSVEAEVIEPKAYCDVSQVLKRYFDGAAPFGGAAKKSEFPDAFALLSLDAWAEKHDTKMIVVSTDGDWESYCSTSPRLIFCRDLALALSCFQKESASYLLDCKLVDGDQLNLGEELDLKLAESQDLIEFDVQASSQFHFEAEVVDAQLSLIEIHKFDGKNYFKVIESSDEEIIAQVELTVEADLEVRAAFATYDSVDRDYVPMGSGTFRPSEEILMEAVVTFEKSGGQISVQEIELLRTSYVVQLDDIEPDWMSDPYDGYDR